MKPKLARLLFLFLPALAQAEGYLVSVAVDGDGKIYVADVGRKAIFRLDGDKLAVVVQGQGKPRTPLYNVRDIAWHSKAGLVVGDPATFEVFAVKAGADPKPLSGEGLAQPYGVAFDAEGALIVSDLGFRAIYRVAGGKPVKIADVEAPTGIALDREGNYIVVTRKRNLVRVSKDGKRVETILKNSPFQFPNDVVVDAQGNYLVSDNYARTIWKVTPAGQASVLAKEGLLESPVGLALESSGNLLVADPRAKAILRIAPDGKVTKVYQDS